MGLPQLPEVRDGVPPWAQNFLGVVRRILLSLAHGIPDRMGRAVTFEDLVDLGLASRDAAQRQAEKR